MAATKSKPAASDTPAVSVKESAATVCVACKIPNGIWARVFRKETIHEPVYGGGVRETTRAVQVGDPVLFKGPAAPFGKMPNAPIEEGFALTHGVPASFWNQWLEDNKDSDFVKNGLIFAHEEGASISTMARENASRLSGLEPLNPETKLVDGKQVQVDKRFPKPANPNLGVVTKADAA